MVALVRAGPDPADVARAFEPSGQAIRNWATEAKRRDGRRELKPAAVAPALAATERDELKRHEAALRLFQPCETKLRV